jgi:hypothetical protein
MSKFKKKIVVTGGTGRFASYLKKNPGNFSMFFQSNNEFNIMNKTTIKKLKEN